MRWAILGAIVLALSGCATTAPPSASRADRWQSDLNTYQEQLQAFGAHAQQLVEDFQALRANPNFAAVEDKVRDLGARIASGDNTNVNGLIVASLYTMTLGELLVFPRFLALSTRWVTLEATRSELENLRLNLWVRRIALERGASRATGGVQKIRLSISPLLSSRSPLLSPASRTSWAT